MHLGKFNIDDVITFAANTHDAATGAATDADAVPAYRVYEDETGTAILTGNMAKLDDANTTGFYSEQLTLSAANGFENGKSYTVYISAAVSSVTGTMHHTFSVGLQKVNVTQFGGTDGTFSGGRPEVNTTHAAGTAWASGAITAAVIATGAIDADAIADNAIDAGALAADCITAAKIANGAIDAATFAADVDAEILSYLVDDATRIDASALNTASGAVGSNGSGLTEAGGTGDQFTAIPWNAAWDVEVQSEVQDAIEANNLDHLAKIAVDTDFATTVHVDSVLGQMVQTADGGFSRATDSQEAIRDRGDAAWTTATGFSTHSAADVWAVGTRTLTSISGLGIALATKLTKYVQLLARKDAAIATDNATELTEINADGGSGAGAYASTTDALEANRDNIGTAGAGLTEAGGTGDQFTAVPWNASWDAEVQSEVADALGVYDPPTKAELDTAESNIRGADSDTLKTLSDQADAIAADLPQRITKNAALAAFPFLMVDATDLSTPETGLTITATRSLDGAAFGACANAVSEIGNGWYKIDLAAGDLNGNTVALRFTASGAATRNITLITQPT